MYDVKVTHLLTNIHEAMCDNGGHFTCGEAEDVAELYREAGDAEAAEVFMDSHAIHDEEGDLHFGRHCPHDEGD